MSIVALRIHNIFEHSLVGHLHNGRIVHRHGSSQEQTVLPGCGY